MRVFKLAAGLATGYVLGSRAGREKYDQIVAAYQKVTSHPAAPDTQPELPVAAPRRAPGTRPMTSALMTVVTFLVASPRDVSG